MRISAHNKKKLEDLGLTLWDTHNRGMIWKKPGIGGNKLPRLVSFTSVNVETDETTVTWSDCPFLLFWLTEGKYKVTCWNWVPGPGPGDFDQAFDTEDKAIEFIISYFFGSNEYFEARKRYEEEEGRDKR